MKKRMKGPGIWAGMLLALIMLIVLPYSVQAQSHNEAYGDGSIHIHLNSRKENVDLSGVRLAVYQVAEGSYFEGQAQLLPDFSEELTHCSMEDMVKNSADASSLLEAWVKGDHPLEPVMAVESDEQGDITFDHLEDGIYLICQENDLQDFEVRGYSITVEPYLVELPMRNKDGGMQGEINCMPKVSMTSTSEERVSVEVEKHWEDQNNQGNFRPDSIEATLYYNGEDQETVTLSAANNWRYVWEDLENNGIWTVKEAAVPAGYESTVTTEGNTFVITNTLLPNDEYGNFTPTTSTKDKTTAVKPPTTSNNQNTPGSDGSGGGSSSGKTSRSLVKTGDNTPIALFLGLLALSAFGIALVLKRHALAKN